MVKLDYYNPKPKEQYSVIDSQKGTSITYSIDNEKEVVAFINEQSISLF